MVYYAVYTAVVLKLCTMKSVVVFCNANETSRAKVVSVEEENSLKNGKLVKAIYL
jgi:hypothetical protein